MEKSLDERIAQLRLNCADCDPAEVEKAVAILHQVGTWPAEKLRQVVRVLDQAEAVRAEGGEELVDMFWRSLGVDVDASQEAQRGVVAE